VPPPSAVLAAAPHLVLDQDAVAGVGYVGELRDVVAAQQVVERVLLGGRLGLGFGVHRTSCRASVANHLIVRHPPPQPSPTRGEGVGVSRWQC
jgi:hypothetical protein